MTGITSLWGATYFLALFADLDEALKTLAAPSAVARPLPESRLHRSD